MTKIFPFILICLFSFVGKNTLQANYDNYKSGHVIVIHSDTKKQKNYVLFGLTKKGELSTFGGLRDKGESNPKNTAAREAEEEGLGVIGNQDFVRKLLWGLKPLTHRGGHYCYILAPKDYGRHISQKFRKIRFDENIKLPYCQKEMVDIVAVKVDSLIEKVHNREKLEFKDNNGKLRSVRIEHVFVKAVKYGYFDHLSKKRELTKDELTDWVSGTVL